MNDDFLKHHQKRPNPQFVENLYQKIEQPNIYRRFYMFTRKMHPAYQVMAILIGIILVSTVVSSDVRAMVKSLFTFNGVEIMLDDSTNELSAEGNEEAITYQDGQQVVIQGIDKEGVEADWLLQVVIEPDTGKIDKAIGNLDEDGNFVPKEDSGKDKKDAKEDKGIKKVLVSDFDTLLPDFRLPTELPDGYTLIPWAYFWPDESVMVNWSHPSAEKIMYIWGELALEVQQKFGTADLSEAFTIVTVEGKSEPITLAVFQGETESVPIVIVATDSTLTEDQLRNMVP